MSHPLREVRKRLDLTQAHLAELAGVTQSLVSMIEHGHTPSIGTLRALADVLCVDWYTLVSDNGDDATA